jgi:hypothetical protein
MLEFIIAFLLSIGYNVDSGLELQKLEPDVLEKIRSSEEFEKYGGEEEFNSILKLDDNEENSEDAVVVMPDVNPVEEAQN